MKRLLIPLACATLLTACDPDELTATNTNGAEAQPTTEQSETDDGEQAEREQQIYMARVNGALKELAPDITQCIAPWKGRYPKRELRVHLVFELTTGGDVDRVKAHVPEEAADIGVCIEKVVAPAKFPAGAPKKPFEKTMVFNEQNR